MLFSLDWLRQYVDLPEEAEAIGRRLTFAGFAIDGIDGIDDGREEKGTDVVFDVDVTTNRPDAMNHLGLARELAVLYERPLRLPETALAEVSEIPETVESAVAVELADPEGCSRFVARVIRGVRIGESPAWLQRRLRAIGKNPINNVVDVTNFVLWEMGQPLHAYDLAKISGAKLVVRRAAEGERLTTLDGVDRALDPAMLVIADASRPVGLAGVMGGADSEVTAATVDILLEGAHFDRKAVRIAAKRLGLHTDASHRFERGADLGACLRAVDRAAALIVDVAGAAGGQVLAGAIDERSPEKPERPEHHGRLDLAKLDAFAGVTIPPADAERWLAGLGFDPRKAGPGLLEITVPSWRYFDVQAGENGELYPQDLYEEVMRIFGFDNIPSALPALPGPDGYPNAGAARRRKVKWHLAASGFAEAVDFAFVDPAGDSAFPSLRPEARALPLENPISERASVMRRSLVPGLVESARFNQRRGVPAVRLFEVATVFFDNPDATLPDQPEMVGLVCGGTVGTPWERQMELDLFDLKGVIESLAQEMGVRLLARPAAGLPGLLAGTAAELYRPERPGEGVGFFGRVAGGEGYPLYVAEIAAEALDPDLETRTSAAHLTIDPPSRFPGIGADSTLTHALDVPWTEIEAAIRAAAGSGAAPDLVSFGLTVRYRGEGVPAGAVNTTIHFFYNSRERSLTQEEVNGQQQALTADLERRFGFRG